MGRSIHSDIAACFQLTVWCIQSSRSLYRTARPTFRSGCVSDNRQRHVSETANFGGTNASDILAAELGNLNAAVGRLRTELFRCQLDFGGGLLIVAELVLWLH